MNEGRLGSPVEWALTTVRGVWRTAKSVYYANSVSWRFLKGGALVFLGFFLWSASNLLLSYQPTWTWLHYPMAYGFVLVLYGPVHHFVVIPLALRLRRGGGGGTRIGRRLPTAALVVFFVVVVAVGTFPAAPVTFEFQSSLADAGADVNPDLLCTKSTTDEVTRVHCHLTESAGIDHVVVESGGERVTTDREPPFDFEFRSDQLTTVTGQKQFQVVLVDGNGDTIRRYTRTLSMVDEG